MIFSKIFNCACTPITQSSESKSEEEINATKGS